MFNSVFISYAKEDINFAQKVYDYLENLGFEPWLDKKKLLVGQNWKIEIDKALRKANFIVLLLSSTSVSKRGFVQREFKAALDFYQDKLEDDVFIIPLKINDCEVPNSLSSFQWIEYENDETLENVVLSIREQIKKYKKHDLEQKGITGIFDFEVISENVISKHGKLTDTLESSVIKFKDSSNQSLNELNSLLASNSLKFKMNARLSFEEYDNVDELADFGINDYLHTYNQSINYIGKNLISINEDLYEYTGGAHGNYWSYGLNYGLEPTHEIHLENLIDYMDLDSFLSFISRYCINSLKDEHNDILRENFEQGDEVFFEDSLTPKLENFNNFLISKESLDFIFNPYQVLPYAFGQSIVKVPYSEILKVISEKNKLLKMIDKL